MRVPNWGAWRKWGLLVWRIRWLDRFLWWLKDWDANRRWLDLPTIGPAYESPMPACELSWRPNALLPMFYGRTRVRHEHRALSARGESPCAGVATDCRQPDATFTTGC
jgi:hypothetical protein